jgi:16S rRNA (guanine1516-N2)-methyltransferase
MHPVPLFCAESARHETAHRLSERFDLSPVRKRPESGYWLELGPDKLELLTTGKHGSVFAEFVEGAARHRRQQGGGRGQPVARAIGLKSGASLPHVVDATAGLGRDAFVLATLGCQVTLIERSPVAAALLYDALERASVDVDTMEIAARMTLVHADAITWLNQQQGEHQPDVVYVDPMFPDTGKSAAAKKDMQAFQQVIGDDLDSSALLLAALGAASNRVVVKRPRLGAIIEGVAPSIQMEGKSTRFDIYSIKALRSAGKLVNLTQDEN